MLLFHLVTIFRKEISVWLKYNRKFQDYSERLVMLNNFVLFRSYIPTVKKQCFSVIDALERILNGKQVYREFVS